jgi:hypothetical protein
VLGLTSHWTAVVSVTGMGSDQDSGSQHDEAHSSIAYKTTGLNLYWNKFSNSLPHPTLSCCRWR